MNDRDIERLEISTFVNMASKMHPLEVIDYCTKQEKWLVDIMTGKNKYYKGQEYAASKLNTFMGGVCYVLHGHAVKPGGVSYDLWAESKPMFEAMVSRNEIPADWLEKIYPAKP